MEAKTFTPVKVNVWVALTDGLMQSHIAEEIDGDPVVAAWLLRTQIFNWLSVIVGKAVNALYQPTVTVSRVAPSILATAVVAVLVPIQVL